MKKGIIISLIVIISCIITYILVDWYLDENYIDWEAFACTYYLTEDIYLSQTSQYMISLRGKYGIQPCVYKIGWNERYIVALQYEMEFEVDRRPDKTKPQYYIIDLEKEEKIGPLTKDEFYEYDCSSIKMKKTIIFG